MQIGTTSAEEVRKLPNVEVKEFNSSADTFMELKAGGVDAVVNDRPVNDYYILKSGEKDVRALDELLTSEDYGLAINKNNAVGHYIDWATPTFYDTLVAELQKLLGSIATPADFTAAVERDYAQFLKEQNK